MSKRFGAIRAGNMWQMWKHIWQTCHFGIIFSAQFSNLILSPLPCPKCPNFPGSRCLMGGMQWLLWISFIPFRPHLWLIFMFYVCALCLCSSHSLSPPFSFHLNSSSSPLPLWWIYSLKLFRLYGQGSVSQWCANWSQWLKKNKTQRQTEDGKTRKQVRRKYKRNINV